MQASRADQGVFRDNYDPIANVRIILMGQIDPFGRQWLFPAIVSRNDLAVIGIFLID
jgi:hypothetical protein